MDLVAEHAAQIRRSLGDPTYVPAPVQAPPPILIAGVGDRMLRVAAREADIVSFPVMGGRADLAERVAFLADAAGDRFPEIELSFLFYQVGIDDPDDLGVLRVLLPGTDDDRLREVVAHLPGPVEAAADRIRALREELGISYFCVNLTPGVRWDTLERLLALLR